MIHAEYVHEFLRKQRQFPQDLLAQHQFDELEQYFTDLWQRREQLPAFAWEELCLITPEQMFRYQFLHNPEHALQCLDAWQQAYPESFYPHWISCFYWFTWGEQYRGNAWAVDVDDSHWRCARETQKQLFAHAMQAFQRSEQASVVCVYLLQSVIKLNMPSWWREWYIKQRSFYLQHKIRSEDLSLAQRSGLHPRLKIDLPEKIPCYLQNKQLCEEVETPLFWLKIYAQQRQYALGLCRIYCQFLLPQWGHDLTDIIEFCDSDYCQDFSELAKNTLAFVAWFAEIEQYYKVDQQTDIRRSLLKAQALYQRPLREQDRARVGLYLIHLYGLLEDGEDYQPHILACYQHAAAFPVFEAEHINQAISYWYLHARSSDFLGKIAYHSRQYQATAAVLYGFLCQHGWSGVEKNPLVAYSWYEYAIPLEPPRAYPEGAHCAYYQVTEVFSEHQDYAIILDLLVAASHLGYVYPSFLAGYIYAQQDSEYFDPDKELLYAKRAAAQRHPSALFNMGVYFLNKALEPEEQQPKWYLQKHIEYLEQCRGICVELEKKRYGSYQFLVDDIGRIYTERLFQYSYYPDIASVVIEYLLVIANQRQVAAMLALAALYADQVNRPQYFDYVQAVRWCEAAYLQQPDNQETIILLNQLNGQAEYLTQPYLQALGGLGFANTPGRQEPLL